MADFDSEVQIVKLAARNVEQLQDVVSALEAKLAEDPEGAKTLIRPCGVLVQKLIEAQASVEALIQKIYTLELTDEAVAKR